jgi:DNA-binding NarL/FixJ family response regulator
VARTDSYSGGAPLLRVVSTDRDRIRVAIADDSFLMREAMAQILGRMDGIELVASCEDGTALWKVIDEQDLDSVVVDLRMPPSGDIEGIEIAKRLRVGHPDVGVVLLTQYAEPRYGLELMNPSAAGRADLLKDRIHDREELESAIRTVARGGTMIDPRMVRMLLEAQQHRSNSPVAELTRRERDVLSEMAQGKSNQAIAETLSLTKRAVEKHVGSIFMKLELADEEMVSRRVAAVLLFLADGRGAGGSPGASAPR